MNITQFTMEEVRCFAECQQFNIRPLTFLVGENSTGKTTALACFEMLVNYFQGEAIDFNSDPYSMGTFKDIVRNSRKTEKVFKLGSTFESKNEEVECTVEFVEKKSGVEPAVKSITVKFADGIVVFEADDEEGIHIVSFDEEKNQYRIAVASRILNGFPLVLLFSSAQKVPEGKNQPKAETAFEKYLATKYENTGILLEWIREFIVVFSTAPIRSQPQRTYDPTRVFNDPGGSDVPQRLMEIKATDKKRWEALKGKLVDFGKSSGLFQNIDIRNFGGSMGNPFQLKVKVKGPISNIIDVGYGISQVLPILVNIFDQPASRRQTYSLRRQTHRRGSILFFLLQQPEVHLHPRAQAALSSLLATAASQEGRSFIVETHSDYMIDRARIEIRKGNIRPEDVSLIYFEPKGNVVKVHNISFDKMGNMEGVPQHYREFFMTEYRRLMGFED